MIPTVGRHGARCGDVFNRSSVFTRSAVARPPTPVSRTDVGRTCPVRAADAVEWGRPISRALAILVHLTSAANAPRLRRSGIRPAGHGQDSARGVHCFPVLPSYTLTHQRLRELARFGSRGGLVAVHVRPDDAQDVLVGRCTDRARDIRVTVSAAEAVRRIAALEDPRGWEVFVLRAIRPREVHRVRTAPQVAGLRYLADAHGVRPCTCFGCQGARRVRGAAPARAVAAPAGRSAAPRQGAARPSRSR